MRIIDADEFANMLSRVRQGLDPKAYKTATEFYTRDEMLLNLEQMVRAAPTIDPVKHGRWRSIKDDFPEKDGRYLVYEPGVGVYDAFTTLQNGKYFWWENSLKPRNVTHWMQLPEPPTGAMDTDE